ncbi:HEAT repeat domain-containing protein [Streptomyces sp. NPDC102402]|uniref:HEAT repeat domain-containing protein n=1 Tax=Streptomyces sp. NPDC102402 TaxID=3366169 RepID=UPI003813BCBC
MPSEDSRLVAAVRERDAAAVGEFLAAGADPDALGEDGLPLICTALAAYDVPVVEVLVAGGADPYRRLPDGSTPLLRAVDGGCVAGVDALIDGTGPVTDAAARAELLDRARQWHGIGTLKELRRRTGDSGSAVHVRVRDAGFHQDYEQFTLGGVTTREGHGEILTALEARFGLRTPFDELAGRALASPGREHADWFGPLFVLSRREDEETWEAAAALRFHEDPVRRLFAAEVLKAVADGSLSAETWPFEQRALEIFLAWAVEERDPAVLVAVLTGLADHDSPEVEAVGLSLLTHPVPGVRCMVPYTLQRSERLLTTAEAQEAVLTLARDSDSDVRAVVCAWLAEYPGRAPEIADALAGLLEHEDQNTRAWAVYGLAQRDDPRCVDGHGLIGPVDLEPWSDTWVLDAVRRYESRLRERPAQDRPRTGHSPV